MKRRQYVEKVCITHCTNHPGRCSIWLCNQPSQRCQANPATAYTNTRASNTDSNLWCLALRERFLFVGQRSYRYGIRSDESLADRSRRWLGSPVCQYCGLEFRQPVETSQQNE